MCEELTDMLVNWLIEKMANSPYICDMSNF